MSNLRIWSPALNEKLKTSRALASTLGIATLACLALVVFEQVIVAVPVVIFDCCCLVCEVRKFGRLVDKAATIAIVRDNLARDAGRIVQQGRWPS